MRWLMALLLLALAAPAASAAEANACRYDRKAMLAMGWADFDQGKGGWRELSARGCDRAAGEIISLYRERHAERLRPGEVRMLDWHGGQIAAALGDTPRAIALFERVLAAERSDPIPENLHYTQATLAFLRKDKPALLEARSRLVALPEPEGFAKAMADFKARTGFAMSWPPNLEVIDGLIACFDKPYREAYGACRPEPKP